MRKLVSLMHMSLDGFVAGPAGEMDWITLDETVFSFVDTFVVQADTAFYGPKTFQMMEAHWPGVLKEPNAKGHQLTHAKWYAKAEKVVFSRKSGKNPTDEVARLRKAPGKNLLIIGSPGLVHSFAQAGLIDEFVILLNPAIIGKGIPMFKYSKARLRLIAAKKFEAGVVGLHYESLR